MERKTDGHRIHRYQQNEQSPLILTEFTASKQARKHASKTSTYDVSNTVPFLGQVHICGEVKAINRIPSSHLDIVY
jgi:hypothetical protein